MAKRRVMTAAEERLPRLGRRKAMSPEEYAIFRANERERGKIYYETHKEQKKKYGQEHKEEIRIKRLKWRNEHRKLQRERDGANREKHREYKREMSKKCMATYRKNHPERVKEITKAYQKRNPQKMYARYQAKNKIPRKEICEMCGAPAKQRHHPDYSKPLEVMHLCSKCHGEIHRAVAAVVKERRK